MSKGDPTATLVLLPPVERVMSLPPEPSILFFVERHGRSPSAHLIGRSHTSLACSIRILITDGGDACEPR